MSSVTSADLPPYVSVIVPVFNDQKLLPVLLRALADQDYPRDRFECLIVDNGSRKPIQTVDNCGLTVRLLHEPAVGSYAARNCGIQAAHGAVLAFTDADCEPRADWLSAAVERLSTVTGLAIVGGAIEMFCRGDSCLDWHSAVNELPQERFIARYHFAATANLIVPRAVFERVGGFDSAFYSGGDCEWGQRAHAQGVALVYAPNSVVRHPARTTWLALTAKKRRITGGHFTLNRRTGRPVRTTLALLVTIASGALVRTWRDERLPSLGCRLQVMSIELALALIGVGEVFRLWAGGQARRQ